MSNFFFNKTLKILFQKRRQKQKNRPFFFSEENFVRFIFLLTQETKDFNKVNNKPLKIIIIFNKWLSRHFLSREPKLHFRPTYQYWYFYSIYQYWYLFQLRLKTNMSQQNLLLPSSALQGLKKMFTSLTQRTPICIKIVIHYFPFQNID